MKYNRLYMAALLPLALGMAGCSATDDAVTPDGEDTPQGQIAVSFTTRSTDATGTTDESFVAGDAVKLIATTPSSGADGTTTSALFNYNGTAWDNTHIVLSAFPATLTAIYPGTEAASATAFTLPADQSTAAKLRAADYMTTSPQTVATAPATGDAPLSLALTHRLCKLTFTVTEYGNEFGATPADVKITDVKVQSKYSGVTIADATNPTVTPTGEAVQALALIAENATDYHHTYTAIVAPGAYAAGDVMLTMTINGKAGIQVKTSATTLTSGSAYAYTLKVGKDKVEITGITIGAWGDNTTATGNTTNVALPDAGSTGVAGIFVHYADADAANADNVKLLAASNWMIDHVWKSQEATPHIVIYSPYAEATAYTGTLALANGSDEALNDYCYASINSDHTQKVSQLLTGGKLSVNQEDYKHKMCRLSIAFADASFNAVTPTAVTLKDIYTAGTLTLNTGAVATTGSQSSVSLTATDGKCPDYYIVPQTIAAGSWLITATIAGKPYEYYTDSTTGLTLAEGNHVTLTLKLPVATRAAATGKMNETITLNNSWK